MTTPEIVRMLRQRKGYKQEHLADAIGISQSYYSKLESGNKEFKVGHIERLAAFLDAPLPELKSDSTMPSARQPTQNGQEGKVGHLLAELIELKKENSLLKTLLGRLASGGV